VSKHLVFSRRDLLRASLASAAIAATPAGALVPAEVVPPTSESETRNAAAQTTLQAKEPLEILSASEMDTLEAIVGRLIPTDVNGPGATEAPAAHFIDRALGGALASSRPG
jgi:gluconate 2-dehydrogenase subunit 3-like protein